MVEGTQWIVQQWSLRTGGLCVEVAIDTDSTADYCNIRTYSDHRFLSQGAVPRTDSPVHGMYVCIKGGLCEAERHVS